MFRLGLPVDMAPSAGLKPATLGLEGRCSIQLSYEGILIAMTVQLSRLLGACA